MRQFALGFVFLLLVALVAFLSLDRQLPRPILSVFGTVPDFSFTDQKGQSYGSDQVRGYVWIAQFFFTSCPAQCPLVTQRLKTVHEHLADDDVQFLSFTIDPKRDTVEKLESYVADLKIDDSSWHFLTGTKGRLDALASNGFRLGSSGLVHSFKLVLVDPKMKIRGYYNGLEPSAFKGLERDAKLLLRDPSPPQVLGE